MAELLSWLDPTGVETPLNGETFYRALYGPQNLHMPPMSIISQQVPMQPGVVDRYVQVNPNDPRIPLLIQADDEATLLQAWRALVVAMNPLRGVGVLRHTAYDGVIRDLSCHLLDGLRGAEQRGSRGPAWYLAGLVFQASDPFWYDAADTFLYAYPSSSPPFFNTPFFPLQMGSSSVSGGFVIVNNGDVECWPIWTITGPGSSITLTNTTTGATFMTSVSLANSSQVLTIDTRPRIKTVKREDGSSQFITVPSTSKLWSLIPGANNISLAITGTSGASSLRLQYKQRYLGV